MKIPYFDLHCDTITEVMSKNQDISGNNLHIDLGYAHLFEKYSQVFALWCGKAKNQDEMEKYFLRLIDTAQYQMSKYNNIFEENHCRAIFSIEGADIIPTPEAVDIAIKFGVKFVGITWNYDNKYGHTSLHSQSAPLTDDGIELVKKLNKHNVFIDISHLSDAGVYNVFEHATLPVIASHSNSRAVYQHKRNILDDQFKLIKESGGLVGINLYASTISGGETVTIDDIIKHIEYFLSLGGSKTLSIGADFDGCELFPYGISKFTDMYKLYNRLLQINYSEDVVRDIFYNNADEFCIKNFV